MGGDEGRTRVCGLGLLLPVYVRIAPRGSRSQTHTQLGSYYAYILN